MKAYGAFKATEFTRKQVGVIYRMAKNGELKVEKWVISELYDLADYYTYDYNGSVAQAEGEILNILAAVFAKDTEKAQMLIDNYTKTSFELLPLKNQQAADRNFL